MRFPDFKNELSWIEKGFLVVGCDEVGRGPVAGPVVACACVLDPEKMEFYSRVRDSKTVKEEEREELSKIILENCVAHGIGIVWQEEIDKINIHNATLKAMSLAVEDLLKKLKPTEKVFILIDGKFTIPGNTYLNTYSKIEQKSIIKGDGSVLSIAAASIIAKVHRDNIMKTLHEKFPEYGFLNNKGYGTKEHQIALKKWGPSLVHRKSFIKNFI